MITERIALTALLLATTAGGYSFHRFQQQRLERRFRAAGLRPYRASLPGGEVRYWAGGAGGAKPLLLVHGFGGDALWGWHQQSSLAKDRFLIVPDLLWFGGSHAPVADYSTAYQAEVMMQLLDHLAIDRMDVAGISYGGFVTLELAHGWPSRFDRVVLVDSPGHTYTLDDYHDMLDRKGLRSVAELVVPDDPSGVQRLIRLAYHRPPPVPAFVARDVFAKMFSTWREQKVRLLDELLGRAGDPELTQYEIHQPTLILWGEHDTLFPASLAHRLAQGIGPNARVELIPLANHAPNMERPLYFNRALCRFLASQRAAEQHPASDAALQQSA